MRVLWQQLDATARLQQGSSFSNLLSELLETSPVAKKKRRKPKRKTKGKAATTDASPTTICMETTIVDGRAQVDEVISLDAPVLKQHSDGEAQSVSPRLATALSGPKEPQDDAHLLMGSEARLLAALGYAGDMDTEDRGLDLAVGAAEFRQMKVSCKRARLCPRLAC